MAVGNRESCRHRSGNHNQRRFRSAGNGLLFDNSLNIEGLRIKGRMENGYEEGCTRGAKKQSAESGGSYLMTRPRGVIPSGSRRFWRAHADLRPPAHLP
jgi:hypothetical protein